MHLGITQCLHVIVYDNPQGTTSRMDVVAGPKQTYVWIDAGCVNPGQQARM